MEVIESLKEEGFTVIEKQSDGNVVMVKDNEYVDVNIDGTCNGDTLAGYLDSLQGHESGT